MNEIKRVAAGVKFESDVLRFVDLLAEEQQRTRSFIINQIIRAYARQLHQQSQPPEQMEAPKPLATPISF